MKQSVFEKSPAPEPNYEGATPLMAQYLAIKAQHPDCLVFFRLGDFYELFFEDAVKASKALDITLTRRGQMNGEDIPMCGVPFHAYENYMAKLLRQGFHVALCEQTEDPAAAKRRGAKSIVTREVVRIITPGTVTEDQLLAARSSNYLACIAQVGQELAVAWIDLASGEPFAENTNPEALATTLARVEPTEIVIAEKTVQSPELFEILNTWRDQLSIQPTSRFNSESAQRRLLQTYGVSEISVFGDFSRESIAALGTLLDYVALTQKCDISHLKPPRLIADSPCVGIDPATRRNLEITRTLSGERRGSLLDVIDMTATNAGGRLLALRLNTPLTNIGAINARLDAVTFYVNNPSQRTSLRQELFHTPDLERALARLSLGRGGPRDLAAIRDALSCSEIIRSALLSIPTVERPSNLKQALDNLGEHSMLCNKLARALKQELPLLTRDGGFIAQGFSAQLDELVTLRDDSRRLIAGLQKKYVEVSGASALKIKHNNVIGYYIEVSPTHAEKLLSQKELFIHRQSMASAMRFTTVELGELEQKISQAADKALAIELHLFDALVQDIVQHLADLHRAAEALAEIDVATALAECAATRSFTRPVVDDSLTFSILKGRHPVVEQALKNNAGITPFVGNSCDLNHNQRLWLLTGPNMAGKSTFLRQNALIVLLAQMGSFVPAETAHIGVVDRLFSRVGAADDLARGQSTFMVEMVETAAILNQATNRSLVILDEIGRGTATYDGLSIAWATVEHLHNVNECRTLFATHYHELTELTETLSCLMCATMKIREWEKEIIFLHEVMKGTADRSYGIHVAQMAGLPNPVIRRAESVLKSLESNNSTHEKAKLGSILPLFSYVPQEESPRIIDSPLESAIRTLNPDDLTPKQALEEIYKLHKLAQTKQKK